MHSGQILNELKKNIYNNGDYILENQICRNVANFPVQAYLEGVILLHVYLLFRVIEIAGINTKGIGTPFYMCPEVIQGIPYDQKVTHL